MIKQGINKLGESRWDERAAQAPPPLHGNGLCIDVGAGEVGMGGEGACAALCVCVAVPSPMKALRPFPSVFHSPTIPKIASFQEQQTEKVASSKQIDIADGEYDFQEHVRVL